MKTGTPVAEEELHAYIDGELPEARRADVEAYLIKHPGEARRLDAYRADGETIARIFSRGDSVSRVTRPASARSLRFFAAVSWRQAAAAVLILAVGTISGWFARDRVTDTDMEQLGREAVAAHLILNSPGVEPLATSSLDDLSRMISDALGVQKRMQDPSSSGFSIVGAQLVPQAKGRAVQLVFKGPNDETITFYFEGRPGAKETPWWRIPGNDLNTFVWQDDDVGCAVTSTLEPKKLRDVGRRIYNALLG
jgi:anti-sigma factor RsiW